MKNSNAPTVKREAEEGWTGHINERDFPPCRARAAAVRRCSWRSVAVHVPAFSMRPHRWNSHSAHAGRGLLLLHWPDLSPDNSSRLTRPERQLGLLQMVCRKGQQLFGHSRLSTRLGESDTAFGYLSMVFGREHS
jgi:hypothetical protein